MGKYCLRRGFAWLPTRLTKGMWIWRKEYFIASKYTNLGHGDGHWRAFKKGLPEHFSKTFFERYRPRTAAEMLEILATPRKRSQSRSRAKA